MLLPLLRVAVSQFTMLRPVTQHKGNGRTLGRIRPLALGSLRSGAPERRTRTQPSGTAARGIEISRSPRCDVHGAADCVAGSSHGSKQHGMPAGRERSQSGEENRRPTRRRVGQ